MEKPIITTNSVGCKEVVENEKNGFLVPIKNSAALADAMIKMMELPYEKRLEMGKYGREKILIEFDEKIVIDKYLKTIEGLMSL
jgi:glycosyltransferase involved in cell wall biosynthesis